MTQNRQEIQKQREILAENLGQEALEQIDTNAYKDFLDKFSHIREILCVGIGFVQKDVRWKSALTSL